MKKFALKTLSLLLAAGLFLPVCVLSAGSGTSTAVAGHSLPQTESAPLFLRDITYAGTPAANPAAAGTRQTGTGSINAQSTAEEGISNIAIGGCFDDDPVTPFEFGSELLNAYQSGSFVMVPKLIDTGGKYPELVLEYTGSGGEPQTIYFGMYYDEQNKILSGRNRQGTFTTGFDMDLEQRMMYSSYNGWNRQLGYTKAYDMLTPLAGVSFLTHRIKFEYGGRDWMIQIWKGLYFYAGSGAEIGIYSKPQSRTVEFYDCAGDEDTMEMSMRLLKDEQVLFQRAPEKHWWMNGFVLSTGVYPPESLTLEAGIRFEDEAMKAAFLVPFEELCAREGIDFSVDGGLVSFVW